MKAHTHVKLNNPEKGDEEKVEGHKETESAPHVRDLLALYRWCQQVRGWDGHQCRVGSIQGGDGGEAAPELPIGSTMHSCCDTGKSTCSKTDISVWLSCLALLLLLLLLPAAPYWSSKQIICLHLTSSVAVALYISSFTTTINLLCSFALLF